jgi:hypothetical protein
MVHFYRRHACRDHPKPVIDRLFLSLGKRADQRERFTFRDFIKVHIFHDDLLLGKISNDTHRGRAQKAAAPTRRLAQFVSQTISMQSP